MKPHIVTPFLFIYLLHLHDVSATNYKIICDTQDEKICNAHSLSKTNYTNGETVKCICPSDSTRIISYTCTYNEEASQSKWEIDTTEQNGTLDSDTGCYACGKGNFLIGTKCYSCADETGFVKATTKEEAVSGIRNCIIPSGDTNEYDDDKGTFKYLAECYFTCTNDNDVLCQSNA